MVLANSNRVKALRTDFENGRGAGVYCWWFKVQMAKEILKTIGVTEYANIQQKKFDNDTYYALYFGISKNIDARMHWHICQHQHGSTLSTLRHTLCGILTAMGMITPGNAETAVNKLIDENCMLEWGFTPNLQTAEQIEKTELSATSYWYPPNIKENKSPLTDKAALKALTKLRKNAIKI